MAIGAILAAAGSLGGGGGGGGEAAAPITQGPVNSGAGDVGGGWTLNVVPRTKAAEASSVGKIVVFSGVVLGLGYFALGGRL